MGTITGWVAASLCVAAAPVDASAQDAEEYRTPNGLRVVLQPLPERRHVAICVTYHAGSRDVPEGYTGLAHLTEHLMFSGTDRIADEGVNVLLDRAGAVTANAMTTPDYTAYYEVLPREQLEWGLWLEAHRMARMLAGLTHERLERQRRIILHEGRQVGRHGSIGRLSALIFEQLYPEGHPYRRIYEHEEDVGAIRLPHVQWFFQSYYGPRNATLSVVGGLDPEAARAEISRYFEPIVASGSPPEPPRPAPPSLERERHVTYDAHTQHDMLYVAWPTPPFFAPGDAELDVIAELLAGSRDRPLSRALDPLTVSSSAGQRSLELGSRFEIQATATRGHHTGELLEAIDRTIADLRRRPPSEGDVRAARERLAAEHGLASEDIAYVARHLGLRTPDGRAPTARYEQERYGAITAQSVREALDRWLAPDRRLVVFVASNPSAPGEGQVVSIREVGAP